MFVVLIEKFGVVNGIWAEYMKKSMSPEMSVFIVTNAVTEATKKGESIRITVSPQVA